MSAQRPHSKIPTSEHDPVCQFYSRVVTKAPRAPAFSLAYFLAFPLSDAAHAPMTDSGRSADVRHGDIWVRIVAMLTASPPPTTTRFVHDFPNIVWLVCRRLLLKGGPSWFHDLAPPDSYGTPQSGSRKRWGGPCSWRRPNPRSAGGYEKKAVCVSGQLPTDCDRLTGNSGC